MYSGANYVHKDMIVSAAKVFREERRQELDYDFCYNHFPVMVLTLIGKLVRPKTPAKRCFDTVLLENARAAFDVVRSIVDQEILLANVDLMRDVGGCDGTRDVYRNYDGV